MAPLVPWIAEPPMLKVVPLLLLMTIVPPLPPCDPKALALTVLEKPAVVPALTEIVPPTPPTLPTALALRAPVTVTAPPVDARL